MCVFELANATGIRPEHASLHLRALNSRGLIRQQRRKMRLICSSEANKELAAAPLLLQALEACCTQKIPAEQVVHQATAFTHPRRIEIIQTIPNSGASKNYLHGKTGISYSALTRHLHKLKDRDFLVCGRNFFEKAVPADPLGKALLRIILPGE